MSDPIIPTPENPIPDVDDIKPGIPTPAWPNEGGSDLPAVTSQDAGKVLTVSDEGEWVAGSGGGGGGGATVLTATTSDGTATLPCTAAELFAYMQSGAVVVKCIIPNPENPSDQMDAIYLVHSATYYHADGYNFISYGFEINCATGSDIPSFPVA